jgi:hypothetical protein
LATNYTAIRITEDGIITSCSKEIDCWNHAECRLGPELEAKCLVQKTKATKIFLDGRIEDNRESWWRRSNKYGCCSKRVDQVNFEAKREAERVLMAWGFNEVMAEAIPEFLKTIQGSTPELGEQVANALREKFGERRWAVCIDNTEEAVKRIRESVGTQNIWQFAFGKFPKTS